MKLVRQTLDERILTLTLTRPEKLNALTPATLAALEAGLDAAEDPEVRVVLLCGEGRSFCSGADVVESLGIADPAGASAFLERLAGVLRRINSLPKPVVAAIQGHAAGGGAELALEADLRIVSDDAVLWFPDVGIGSTPASVWHLVEMVGSSLTTEMVMLGRRLDAAEMAARSMVQDVVPREHLDARARQLAERLRDAGSAVSMRYAKRAIGLASQATREVDLQANVSAMLACYWSDEQRATVEHFGARADLAES